ncbi:myelin transcription factor 1 isoform X2 [Eurytemora carolleeae]|nr:myelin transcription factor 1 isoform X2 [Eurytemora carolleeae]|eukprot:XP_023338395.1 myelin transcription factor 1-like isoform X2 [Eurytemora affinis]
MKDDVVGRMRDEMEALLSEESSGEEEEEDEDERDDYQNGKIEGKDGKKESVKILYYHETRQIEDKMTENEAGDGTPVDEGGWNEYG